MVNPAITRPGDTRGPTDLEIALGSACATRPAPADLNALIAVLREMLPGMEPRHALTRGGWHRLGGLVDQDGQRIAHQILAWAEAESGGDIDELLLKVADLPYIATRLNGQTHYLVAPIGPGSADFLQIEVEQLQEVQDRPITAPDWFPDSIAEFVDPLDFPHLEPKPLGPPRLLFRRLLRVPDFMASREAGPRLQRFVRDWERCSAQESAHFSEHWVLSIRESQNRKGALHLSAKPIPILAGEIPLLPDGEVARGALLANRIHGFDRALGYPFAWYFHMLTSPKVSHRLAEAVHADLMGAYAYLPARDLKILRDWYADPYGL